MAQEMKKATTYPLLVSNQSASKPMPKVIRLYRHLRKGEIL